MKRINRNGISKTGGMVVWFRRGLTGLLALLLTIFAWPIQVSDAEANQDNILQLTQIPTVGDTEIHIMLAEGYTAQEVNVFIQEESIAASAEMNGQQMDVVLSRPLKSGEQILILVNAVDAQSESCSLQLESNVRDAFSSRLLAMRERADEVWPIWRDYWYPLFAEGQVYLPPTLTEIPFFFWPDEAPNLTVTEQDGKICIRLSDREVGDWKVCLGLGTPVVYSACEWSEELNAWVGEGEYDRVCLLSDATPERFGMEITYHAEQDFLPSYPVIEWEGEIDGTAIGMNCYGWGTPRSFDGGMYAIGTADGAWYAEYGADKTMLYYKDAAIDCSFDQSGKLLSGDLPEGYQDPVILNF